MDNVVDESILGVGSLMSSVVGIDELVTLKRRLFNALHSRPAEPSSPGVSFRPSGLPSASHPSHTFLDAGATGATALTGST